MKRPRDTYPPDWPRCSHDRQMTTDGCRDCLREARALAEKNNRDSGLRIESP